MKIEGGSKAEHTALKGTSKKEMKTKGEEIATERSQETKKSKWHRRQKEGAYGAQQGHNPKGGGSGCTPTGPGQGIRG